jgi:hypothetical protein
MTGCLPFQILCLQQQELKAIDYLYIFPCYAWHICLYVLTFTVLYWSVKEIRLTIPHQLKLCHCSHIIFRLPCKPACKRLIVSIVSQTFQNYTLVTAQTINLLQHIISISAATNYFTLVRQCKVYYCHHVCNFYQMKDFHKWIHAHTSHCQFPNL